MKNDKDSTNKYIDIKLQKDSMYSPLNIIITLLKNIFYIVISLIFIMGGMYGIEYIFNNSTVIQASSICENDSHPMKVQKILSVVDSIAELQMEDGSIEEYVIRIYLKGGTKGGSIRNIKIKENDVICVKNKSLR